MLNEMLYVVKQIMYHEHWRPSGTEKVEHIYT